MKIVDFVLHPGVLFVLAAGGVGAGWACHNEWYRFDHRGTDGLVLGLFLFASTALACAVVRRGQQQRED